MSTHDARVKACKIKCGDWAIICTSLSIENGRPLIFIVTRSFRVHCWNHKPEFARLARQLRKHLDLLTAFAQVRQGNPCRLGHLDEILNHTNLFRNAVRKLRILDTVLCHFTKQGWVTTLEPNKHLLDRHVNLLILEKVRRDGIQRVALEFVFTFDILEHIKHVPTKHGNHLHVVRSERVGRQVLDDEFVWNVFETTPHVCIRSCDGHDRTRVQVLQVKPEDVPTSHNVRIELPQVPTEALKHLTLRLKRLALWTVRLFDAKTLSIKVPFATKLLCGDRHLETRVLLLECVWERPRFRVRLDIEACDAQRCNVVAVDGFQGSPIGHTQINVARRIVARTRTLGNLNPPGRLDLGSVHETQDRIEILLVHLESSRTTLLHVCEFSEPEFQKCVLFLIPKPPEIFASNDG